MTEWNDFIVSSVHAEMFGCLIFSKAVFTAIPGIVM
jgi:hypothetical protein